jgi:hypothetical protein
MLKGVEGKKDQQPSTNNACFNSVEEYHGLYLHDPLVDGILILARTVPLGVLRIQKVAFDP